MIVLIFFSLHLIVNAYVFWHAYRLFLPRGLAGDALFWLPALFLLAAFPAARLPPELLPPSWRNFLSQVGAWWYGFLFYFALLFLLGDILRLAAHPWRSRLCFWSRNPVRGRILALTGCFLVTVLVFYGHHNAGCLVVSRTEVHLPGCGGPLRRVRIGVASDIHLGMMNGDSTLERVVRAFSRESPDLIVLLGDTVDRHHQGVDLDESIKVLSGLAAPLGVYAVLGNHEHLTGLAPSLRFFDSAGIVVLRDEALLVGESFWLAARDDCSRAWWGEKEIPLAGIVPPETSGCPLVVLDHQPLGRRVKEAAAVGAGLEICGHIHAGQVSPFEWVVRLFFPYIYGRHQVGTMTLLVTSGAGCWGPPIRIGNRPEILLVTLILE